MKRNMKAAQWQDITPTQSNAPIKIIKGKTVQGYLIGITSVKSKFGKNFIYSFQTQKTGEITRVWGNAALNRVFIDGKVPKRDFIGREFKLIGGDKIKVPGRAQPFQSVKILMSDRKLK